MIYLQKVSIIILNWNGLSNTLECLESVKAIDYPNYEIIVVDNGSTDGSANKIKEHFADIVVITTGINLGFAEGNNVGIRYALNNGADAVFLLNNDTIVDRQILRAFVDASALYPQAGVLGSKNFYYSKPEKVCSVGMKWIEERLDFVLLGDPDKYSEQPYSPGFTLNAGKKYDSVIEMDAVMGCGLFIKAQVIKSIGLLDGLYFLYGEENDLCTRAIRAGYKCLFIPSAILWHKVAASSGKQSPMRSYFRFRNRLYYAKKHLPLSKRISLYGMVLRILFPAFRINRRGLHPLYKQLFWSILQYQSEMRQRYANPSYRAMLWGIRDYFLNRLGDCPKKVRTLPLCEGEYWS